jgi:hypothetical protein
MAYISQTINLIAWTDASEEVSIPVRKVILEQSPIFQGWIQSPDTMPDGLRRGNDICFYKLPPEALSAFVRYLENRSQPIYFEAPKELRPKLLLSLYKLAISTGCVPSLMSNLHHHGAFYCKHLRSCRLIQETLMCRLHDLAGEAFSMLAMPKYDTSVFLGVIIEAESLGLMGSTRFQGWAVSCFMRIKDEFPTNVNLRQAVMAGGEDPWKLCCSLVSLVGELGAEHGYSGENGAGDPLLTPKKSPKTKG